jgi:hypothetical protein
VPSAAGSGAAWECSTPSTTASGGQSGMSQVASVACAFGNAKHHRTTETNSYFTIQNRAVARS